jgi:hypothetical protein
VLHGEVGPECRPLGLAELSGLVICMLDYVSIDKRHFWQKIKCGTLPSLRRRYLDKRSHTGARAATVGSLANICNAMSAVELRSDTLTRPTEAMRRAMYQVSDASLPPISATHGFSLCRTMSWCYIQMPIVLIIFLRRKLKGMDLAGGGGG